MRTKSMNYCVWLLIGIMQCCYSMHYTSLTPYRPLASSNNTAPDSTHFFTSFDPQKRDYCYHPFRLSTLEHRHYLMLNAAHYFQNHQHPHKAFLCYYDVAREIQAYQQETSERSQIEILQDQLKGVLLTSEEQLILQESCRIRNREEIRRACQQFNFKLAQRQALNIIHNHPTVSSYKALKCKEQLLGGALFDKNIKEAMAYLKDHPEHPLSEQELLELESRKKDYDDISQILMNYSNFGSSAYQVPSKISYSSIEQPLPTSLRTDAPLALNSNEELPILESNNEIAQAAVKKDYSYELLSILKKYFETTAKVTAHHEVENLMKDCFEALLHHQKYQINFLPHPSLYNWLYNHHAQDLVLYQSRPIMPSAVLTTPQVPLPPRTINLEFEEEFMRAFIINQQEHQVLQKQTLFEVLLNFQAFLLNKPSLQRHAHHLVPYITKNIMGSKIHACSFMKKYKDHKKLYTPADPFYTFWHDHILKNLAQATKYKSDNSSKVLSHLMQMLQKTDTTLIGHETKEQLLLVHLNNFIKYHSPCLPFASLKSVYKWVINNNTSLSTQIAKLLQYYDLDISKKDLEELSGQGSILRLQEEEGILFRNQILGAYFMPRLSDIKQMATGTTQESYLESCLTALQYYQSIPNTTYITQSLVNLQYMISFLYSLRNKFTQAFTHLSASKALVQQEMAPLEAQENQLIKSLTPRSRKTGTRNENENIKLPELEELRESLTIIRANIARLELKSYWYKGHMVNSLPHKASPSDCKIPETRWNQALNWIKECIQHKNIDKEIHQDFLELLYEIYADKAKLNCNKSHPNPKLALEYARQGALLGSEECAKMQKQLEHQRTKKSKNVYLSAPQRNSPDAQVIFIPIGSSQQDQEDPNPKLTTPQPINLSSIISSAMNQAKQKRTIVMSFLDDLIAIEENKRPSFKKTGQLLEKNSTLQETFPILKAINAYFLFNGLKKDDNYEQKESTVEEDQKAVNDLVQSFNLFSKELSPTLTDQQLFPRIAKNFITNLTLMIKDNPTHSSIRYWKVYKSLIETAFKESLPAL